MSREQYAPMSVYEIPEDSTAAILEYEFTTNGAADDLSSATGDLYFNARTRDGVSVVKDGVATWVTDGSEGKVKITPGATVVSNGPRNLICDFEVQGYNGGNLVCRPFILRIIPRARVA